jgi:hypothetical protein
MDTGLQEASLITFAIGTEENRNCKWDNDNLVVRNPAI